MSHRQKQKRHPRPGRIVGLVFPIACVLMALACSTPAASPDPHEVALAQSKNTVLASVQEGFEESEDVDEFVVRARRNPCQCDAPVDEIYVHGRWTRVYFEAGEELLSTYSSAMSEAKRRARLRTVEMRGAFTGDTRSSARGIEFPVFELLELREKLPAEN